MTFAAPPNHAQILVQLATMIPRRNETRAVPLTVRLTSAFIPTLV